MATGKKYGLIIPKAKNSLFTKKNGVSARPSVFGNDSSSDEDAHKEVNAQIHREALKKKIQKQTKIEIQKALEQDSTVYEYDSIYDDMKEKSKKKIPADVAKADKQRKPKYIGNLIKAAEKRTKERERIEERKIQREREKEGDEFDDKEEFVTSAYRQKMLERQQEIDEEKRMDAIEEALDVRKQRDLTGFYRNFLNRELCEEPNDGDSTEPAKSAALEELDMSQNQDDEDTDLSFSSDENQHEKSSSSPERRQSSIDKQGYRDDERRHNSHDNERVSHKKGSKDHDTSRADERCNRSPELRYRKRDSPQRGHSPTSKRDRDKHSHSSSHDRDRRSSHERYRHGKHDRDVDERSRKRDSSRDRHHRKRRRRHDRDRSSSRSASPSPGHSKDSKSSNSSTDRSSKAEDGKPEAGTGAVEAGTSAEHSVLGPMVEEKPTNSFARRTDKDKALSARERYLARKESQRAKPVIDSD